MKAKKTLLLIIMFFIAGSAFSFSRRIETLSVHNRSSKTVIITREFSDASKNYNPITRSWRQNLFGLETTIRPTLFGADEIRVPPGRNIEIVVYQPVSHILGAVFFDNIMRSIFNSLRIATEDAKTVITLDNLEEHTVKKLFSGEIAFVVYIYD